MARIFKAGPGPSRNARLAAREIRAMGKDLEPAVARAFTQAVKSIRDEVKLQELARAIEQGNLQEALDIVGAANIAARMQGGGMVPGTPTFVDKIVQAFRRGADSGMKQLPPKAALAATLDLTNPEAVRYLSTHIPSLIREVTDETMRAVQTTLLRGFNEGIPPIKMAREIRGVVGLTEKQAEAVVNFRRQLETGELGTGKIPWKRRLSATEQAQARSIFRAGGQSGERVDALVARYEQSLINRRAINIAVTETNRAFSEGQAELWNQAESQGLIDRTKTRRFWLVTRDERSRKAHRQVPIDNPDGVAPGEPYTTVVGAVMHPRTSGVASFDISCFLPGTMVRGSFVSGLQSRYSGDVVELINDRGMRLTVTPNHPVLTSKGFVAAGAICEGDDLVCYGREVDRGRVGSGNVDEQDTPARIEDVIEALAIAQSTTLPISLFNLHGDHEFIEGDIRQVGADGSLEGRYFTGFRQHLMQFSFILPHILTRPRICSGSLESFGSRMLTTLRCSMSRLYLKSLLFRGHLAPFEALRFGTPPDFDSVFDEYSGDRMTSNPELIAEFLQRGAGCITLNKVVRVCRYPFTGHVYDLQSESGLLVADNFITSNCRCTEYLEFNDLEEENAGTE